MNATELSQRVQFVVDAEGHKSAVLLSVHDWEQLLTLLEDLEDAEEIHLAREEDEEAIPWGAGKNRARYRRGIDVYCLNSSPCYERFREYTC